MPTAHLEGRATVMVTGADAETFLQNILTTDLSSLGAGEARPGALLSPQGKILFDFLVSRVEEGLRLETRSEAAGDFVRRLMLYRLRAKADISQPDESVVAVSWDAGSPLPPDAVRDLRFREPVFRHYGERTPAGASQADWHAYRIAQGIAESGDDYALGDAFPHDVLLDQTGGIGFTKGCYVGQEVVSRMQHRGTARRRILVARADGRLPEPGTSVTAAGRSIGSVGSSSGNTGLALVRIDRVKDATDAGAAIMAGDVAVSLEIPEWASFTFPDAPGED